MVAFLNRMGDMYSPQGPKTYKLDVIMKLKIVICRVIFRTIENVIDFIE